MEVFTVFVNNLPQRATVNWVAKVFQKFGKIEDVFILFKKSRWGRRIGFVRFSSLADARRAVWNLNGVWFLDQKIGVNLEKYKPRKAFWRKSDGDRNANIRSRELNETGEESEQSDKQTENQNHIYFVS
ncbi:hypothetical protein REPUB_Repub17cG0013000 [Reevesia pubescens]